MVGNKAGFTWTIHGISPTRSTTSLIIRCSSKLKSSHVGGRWARCVVTCYILCWRGWVQVPTLLAIQLPANASPGRQQVMAQILGALPPVARPGFSCRMLVLAWPGPGCFRHLENKQWMKISVFVSTSLYQIR